MAVAAPLDIRTPPLAAAGVEDAEAVVHDDDLELVRRYCVLAAACRALSVILLALLGLWISTQIFAERWESRLTLAVLTAALALAVLQVLLATVRVRSYSLALTAEAVIFEYGRKRAYVPRGHIQLFDTESSIVLRMFGLKRCSLHTGGGTVIVSPVPARVAAAIERLISEPPAPPSAGPADDGS